jgi:hypothetical protein
MERLRRVAAALAQHGQREMAREVAEISLAVKRASSEQDEPMDDPFSREEMASGAVIRENRRGGYDVSFDGKHMGSHPDMADALRAINQRMHQHGYYPNIYFVNDHGNVDLLDSKGKILDSRV